MLARLKQSLATRMKAFIGGTLAWAGVNWTSDLIAELGGGGSSRNAEAWLKAFRTCTQLRAPVDRICKDAAAVPFWLKRRIKNKPVGINGKVPAEIVHEGNASELESYILGILKRPNSRMTGTQFRWLIGVYLELVGFAPVVVEFANVRLDGKTRRVPSAFKPIPPHRVVSLPTKGKPYFRVMLATGKTHDYQIGEILWLNQVDPLDPYGMGAGAAPAVDDEVSQLHWANVWNNNFYRQGARPGAIVGLEGASPDTKKQIQDSWNSQYVGTHNAWKTLFSEGKVHYTDLSKSHREQDFTGTQQHLGDRLRFNWTMPPELLGDVRNSNRATIQGAEKVHQSGNLAPRCLFFEEHFNLFIIPLFGDPDLFLEWANPVQKTEELMHTALTEGWDSGTVTRDEWRMGHQMDPVGDPWGNMWNVPLNMQGYSMNDQPPAAPSPEQAQMEAVKRVYDAAEELVQGRSRNGKTIGRG